MAACGKIMWQCVSCQKIKSCNFYTSGVAWIVVEVRVKNNHGQVSVGQIKKSDNFAVILMHIVYSHNETTLLFAFLCMVCCWGGRKKILTENNHGK